MGAPRKDINSEEFKRDYEGGMPCRQLEEKYAIGANTTAYHARRRGFVDLGGSHWSRERTLY